jgi:putative holliday junction resolvase
MGRILSLDYGKKRSGLAVTDTLRLSVNPLEKLDTSVLPDFLARYISSNDVAILLVGKPEHIDGTPVPIEKDILLLIDKIAKQFPELKIIRVDESLTSKKAMDVMIMSGVPKMKRRDKGLLDVYSAMVILHEYLENHPDA